MKTEEIKQIVRLALNEDIRTGDITTSAVFKNDITSKASFIAKQDGVIAGLKLAEYIMAEVDDTVVFQQYVNDGDFIKVGDLIADCTGPSASILIAERTILNFMQRMSGIATLTNLFCKAVNSSHTKILDTRKTLPGHRYLDKIAVKAGGGENHRYCLDDMYLIKENHISVAGGISEAISRCMEHKRTNALEAKIEIEVGSIAELKEALSCDGVDIIMLDNMSIEDMKQAVEINAGKVKLEASGNMSLERVSAVASTGVDFISVGVITHSAQALDISLLFEK